MEGGTKHFVLKEVETEWGIHKHQGFVTSESKEKFFEHVRFLDAHRGWTHERVSKANKGVRDERSKIP